MKNLPKYCWEIKEINQEKYKEMMEKIPELRWYPWLVEVYLRRGIESEEELREFLYPESVVIPHPREEFSDLEKAVELLGKSIQEGEQIGICGDYDVDGMTSTALLIRSLRALGGEVSYEIPSRLSEGYGINERIVESCYEREVKLILTVDNGINAIEPIKKAKELGMKVIITDHHEVPAELPIADAILNPKLLPKSSPYASLAGVGMAYTLALSLAERLDQWRPLVRPLRELCTLGTIADMVPLKGVNRRWVKRGLKTLPDSNILGIQALIQSCNLNLKTPLKPTAIGFHLGPRINAIGRIGDPQVIMDLLVTEDWDEAQRLAAICEATNQKRQELCQQIEAEAIAEIEESGFEATKDYILVLAQPHWHYGVVGIVASRLVQRYGVPVFLGSGGCGEIIRGSARSIPGFDLVACLKAHSDLLLKYGGHQAAAGFTLPLNHLPQFKEQLRVFAQAHLSPEQLRPRMAVDAEVSFADLTWDFYDELEKMEPFGIENPEPIFLARHVNIVQQAVMGAQKKHLMLTLEQNGKKMKAKAWNWASLFPLPSPLDILYHLKLNYWMNEFSLELELLDAKPSFGEDAWNPQKIY